jgi:hypothetical protein
LPVPPRRFLGLAGPTEGKPVDPVTYNADPRRDPQVLARPTADIVQGRRIH